jgi:hypothetical protein
LAAGVLVKASGLLLVVVRATQLAVGRLRPRPSPTRLAAAALVAVATTLGVVFVAARHFPVLRLVTALIGAPDAIPHCTRSIECIPRALLYWCWGWPMASWLVGIAFRAAGGLWLCWIGWRAHLDGERRILAWAATGLFGYYLLLHGFMQTWYLLSLVPLLAFAEARLAPAMSAYLIASLAYYAVRLPLSTDPRPTVIATKELIEGLTVVTPPLVLLARQWRHVEKLALPARAPGAAVAAIASERA